MVPFVKLHHVAFFSLSNYMSIKVYENHFVTEDIHTLLPFGKNDKFLCDHTGLKNIQEHSRKLNSPEWFHLHVECGLETLPFKLERNHLLTFNAFAMTIQNHLQ